MAYFAEVVNRKTRVLSVSSVQFFDGYRSNLKALSALCKDHGIFFVVDAIQSLGVFPLNVEEKGIDVLCADGHKCMLAPEGCAYLFCSQHALDVLHTSSLGWASVQSTHDFLSYDQIPHPDAQRFESGTPAHCRHRRTQGGNRLPRSLRNRHDLKTSPDAYRPTLQRIKTAWIFDSNLKGRRP